VNIKMGFQLPPGMKDLLPGEASFKRKLENTFMDKFTSWGYQEVITPVLEYYQKMAWSEISEEQFFKLIDREGKILALRTDMTTPIARMVASRFHPEQLPLRLSYTANVFRFENPQTGRQREFYQAGVECIGEQGPAADAEVIALAVECLKESGLTGFQISIGHVGFLKGIIDQLPGDLAVKKKIMRALGQKDFVELEIILQTYRVEPHLKDFLLSLPSLRGDAGIIDKVAGTGKSTAAREALEDLREVFRLLRVYQVEKEVYVDFGLTRDFNYYSGIVFEGYSPGIGVPICGGGRYDHLLGLYGFPAPATGFAMGLERLMAALEGQNKAKKSIIDFLVIGTDWEKVVQKARELREQGFSVRISQVKPGRFLDVGHIIQV